MCICSLALQQITFKVCYVVSVRLKLLIDLRRGCEPALIPIVLLFCDYTHKLCFDLIDELFIHFVSFISA